MVQLFAPYIDHESHSAQRHRQTDGQTDVIAYANSRSYCVAVRSAKNLKSPNFGFLGFCARQHICYSAYMWSQFCPSGRTSVTRVYGTSRKPCYRKGDRAMRPIYDLDAVNIFETLWLRSRLPCPKLLICFYCNRPQKVRTKFSVGSFIRSWYNSCLLYTSPSPRD